MTSPARIAKGKYWQRAWSLVDSCTPVSGGCEHCWSRELAHRFGRDWTTVHFREDRLELPLRVKRPTTWAVWNDLFHEAVSFEQIMAAWDIMEVCPQHAFLVLTKRAWRMNNVVEPRNEPLENVWLGVTAENQTRANERIPLLLQTPAAVRFVSLEPLLIPITKPYELLGWHCVRCGKASLWIAPGKSECCGAPVTALDWVVIGCESGPHRRPCRLEWIEDIVQQCEAAGVPVFVKQAEIGGKLVKAPVILGRKRLEMPKGVKP